MAGPKKKRTTNIEVPCGTFFLFIAYNNVIC